MSGILLVVSSLMAQASPELIQSKTTLPEHPRIFMTRQTAAKIRTLITKDTDWNRLHNLILDEACVILTQPLPERRMVGKRLLATSREELRRILFLGYAWRLSGDRKFARRMDQELVAIASFSDWNPDHFLDVAEMTVAMSVGYDWLDDYLPESKKKQIREAIIDKGLQPSYPQGKDHAFAARVNNWNQVCNAGMSVGAIAVFEHYRDTATLILNRAIQTIPASMAGYAPNGAYPEGISYWEYGTTYNTMLLDGLMKNFRSDYGLAAMPGFMESGLYAQQMITPGLRTFNYCDNFSTPDFLPASFWFYGETKNPALLYAQKRLLQHVDEQNLRSNRFLPMALIWGAEANASLDKIEEPATLAWKGDGKNPVVVFRSSWKDPNGLYLGLKGGSAQIDHGHLDVGSFLFEADNIRWALDLGQENYTNLEKAGLQLWGRQRWDIFRHHNFSHNVITINDKLQDPKGHADFDLFSVCDSQMTAGLDLTGQHHNWVKSIRREASLVDKRYVVITDSIETYNQYTKATWNMATEAETMTPLSDHIAVLEKEGKKLYIVVDSPVKIRFFKRSAQSDNYFDSPNPGICFVGFEAELPLKQRSAFKVFLYPNKIPER